MLGRAGLFVLCFSCKLLIYKDAVNTSMYALPPRPCCGSLINQHLAAFYEFVMSVTFVLEKVNRFILLL